MQRTASNFFQDDTVSKKVSIWDSGEVTERPKVPDSKSGVVHATEGSNPSLSAKFVLWRVDREADGARLEFVCSSRYRGFESLTLRHFITGETSLCL